MIASRLQHRAFTADLHHRVTSDEQLATISRTSPRNTTAHRRDCTRRRRSDCSLVGWHRTLASRVHSHALAVPRRSLARAVVSELASSTHRCRPWSADRRSAGSLVHRRARVGIRNAPHRDRIDWPTDGAVARVVDCRSGVSWDRAGGAGRITIPRSSKFLQRSRLTRARATRVRSRTR